MVRGGGNAKKCRFFFKLLKLKCLHAPLPFPSRLRSKISNPKVAAAASCCRWFEFERKLEQVKGVAKKYAVVCYMGRSWTVGMLAGVQTETA